tara:strand:+ start:786 stop:1037 length:252 start_codon:yes stop_codon:yes gene_type:complete
LKALGVYRDIQNESLPLYGSYIYRNNTLVDYINFSSTGTDNRSIPQSKLEEILIRALSSIYSINIEWNTEAVYADKKLYIRKK